MLVRGGPEGDSQLQALPFIQFQGETSQVSALATVHSIKGDGRASKPLTDASLTGAQEDLRKFKVHDRHRLVSRERATANNGTDFLINNNKMFDADRLDAVMHLGKVSEWTVVNTTTEWHTFHIHLGARSPCTRGRPTSRASSSFTATCSSTKTTA